MLNFKDNFFFFKFSVLFFILLIFGYWGIDLNSEEVYIAFSFLLLVVFGFSLSRVSVLYFFTKSLNKKYSRQLTSYLYIIGYLDLELDLYATLIKLFEQLVTSRFYVKHLFSRFSGLKDYIRSSLFFHKNNFRVILVMSLLLFFSQKSKLRGFFNFKNKSSRVFRFSSLV